jgi:hypothetical protein
MSYSASQYQVISIPSLRPTENSYSITGTSSGSDKAVVATLDCSPGTRCTNIRVDSLSLAYVLYFTSSLPLISSQLINLATDHRANMVARHTSARTRFSRAHRRACSERAQRRAKRQKSYLCCVSVLDIPLCNQGSLAAQSHIFTMTSAHFVDMMFVCCVIRKS